MGYRWIPAEPAHVETIAARARQADVDELWASAKVTPTEAMRMGMKNPAWTGLIGDLPVCMFGVTPLSLLGGVGAPWMIGTEDIQGHSAAFLRGSRRVVAGMGASYDHLVNFVDARHTEAIRWLHWLGFTIHEAQPYGPFNLPFHRFERRA